MNENPRASDEEQELFHRDDRGREEERMRGAEADDPEEQRRRAFGEDAERDET